MNLNEQDLGELCEVATEAAVAAGRYIQSQFDTHYSHQHKAGGDSLASQIVTTVDLKAQEIILTHLQEAIRRYDLGVLTEEAIDDQSRMEKDCFWCIDPMDGTLPFTEGRTGYAVSIALVKHAGDPIIGVVYIPDLAACYTSIKGQGVRLNSQPFNLDEVEKDDTLHIYMDRSLQTEAYFDLVTSQLNDWATTQRTVTKVKYHTNFGAVRNAIGVMSSDLGCYFKFPKSRKGGGSSWDYAATRLFFEELELYVSDSQGRPLLLNHPKTTFMNRSGVLYVTQAPLAAFIKELAQGIE